MVDKRGGGEILLEVIISHFTAHSRTITSTVDWLFLKENAAFSIFVPNICFLAPLLSLPLYLTQPISISHSLFHSIV